MLARSAALTTATIPADATHGEWRVVHTPNETTEGTHTGTVTVTGRTGVRLEGIVTDTFFVEERPEIGVAGRLFLVHQDRTNGAAVDAVTGRPDAEQLDRVCECRVSGESGSCACDGYVASKGPPELRPPVGAVRPGRRRPAAPAGPRLRAG